MALFISAVKREMVREIITNLK